MFLLILLIQILFCTCIESVKVPGVSLPLEALPDAREKKKKEKRGKGYVFQGWARNARTAKKGLKSWKTVKSYPNCYGQSLAVRLYDERVGKLRHIHKFCQWRTVGQRIGGGGTEWKSDKCEGAKRPSGGRVWEGVSPLPR